MFAFRQIESRYRVDEFRRYLEGTSRRGAELVQFWGSKATREKDGPWEVGPDGVMHTVEVARIRKIRDKK